MKKIHFLLMILMLPALLISCLRKNDWDVKSEYKPLLMPYDQLQNSVAFKEKRELKDPGKIYYNGGYIFVNERYKGVHVINNQDPANPQNIGFIQVPGCLDMAMKGNVLYVDNAIDLVTIDLSDPANPQVSSRTKGVFRETTPPDGGTLGTEYTKENRPANTVIVEWVKI